MAQGGALWSSRTVSFTKDRLRMAISGVEVCRAKEHGNVQENLRQLRGSKAQHRQFFDWLGTQLEYKEMGDWYSVTVDDIYKHGKGLLNRHYNDSPSQALQTVYPEHDWMLWRFGHTPKDFWENNSHHRQFFDWLGGQLGYKEMDDWHNITQDGISQYGKGLLNRHYNDSPSQALQTVYPEHDWMLWRFGSAPKTLWENSAHHRQFFDWLGTQLEYKCMEDWYNITVDYIYKHGGEGLLIQQYSGSSSQALQTVYPEHDWMMWRFGHTPKGYWENNSHHRYFCDWLGAQLGYKKLEDWYKVTHKEIINHGGGAVLGVFSNSVARALQVTYPEHDWKLREFNVVKELWHKHRQFFDQSGVKLEHKKLEDWYNVPKQDVQKYGGGDILDQHYRGSPSVALQTLYPDHDWMLWRFKPIPTDYVEKLRTLSAEKKRILDWISKEVSIKQLDDWYRVSSSEVRAACHLIGYELWLDMLTRQGTKMNLQNFSLQCIRTINGTWKSCCEKQVQLNPRSDMFTT